MDDEFLITNQLGGYASSTFHSGNTRKYHGVLVASTEELERKVILSQLEERIHTDGKDHYFSTTTFYPEVISPNGAQFLKKYSLHHDTICFEYEVAGARIFKEINLAQEANCVNIRYKFKTDQKLTFYVAPLITNRNIHHLARYSNVEVFKTNIYLNNARINLSSFEELNLKVLFFNPKQLLDSSYSIKKNAHVYQNFYYKEEALRGLDKVEDLIKPLECSFNIEPGESYLSLLFNYKNDNEILPGKVNNALKLVYNLDYTKKEVKHTPLLEFKDYLRNRYHDFLVDNNYSKSIIAGFPWFADWGRDTFISLPGLLLSTQEYRFAREVINYWMQYIRDGLVPNSVRNKAYNSIDASLWFVLAIYRYYAATKDKTSLKSWFPRIRNLILEIINGSSFTICLDERGFLIWTSSKYNLTWMDSEVEGVSTTGRIGACVEIQMLWYNCLKIFEYFLKELGVEDGHEEVTSLSKKVYQKFNKLFWNETLGYAYDFIDGNKADPAIRPNVLMGLSLPYKLFDKKKTEKLLEKARKDLYTEAGMMTLNKTDLKYIGQYSGTQKERDRAYHNGTIWPFLLGFYEKAVLNAYPKDIAKKQQVKEDLISFWQLIKSQKLNYLPEVFAANDLHPDGCLSQAWNYALFLEVYQMLT